MVATRLVDVLNAKAQGGAVGDDSTDDTAALQASIDYGLANDRPIYIPPGTYKVTAPLDMRGEGLRVYGHGRELTIIKQYTDDTPVIQLGRRFQHITDLQATYAAAQEAADTDGNCFEFYKAYWGTYERLYARLGARGFDIPQVNYDDGDTTTNNHVFSCLFNDCRVTGYALNALRLNSFGGGSTGSVWNNTYLSNNPTGTRGTPAGSPVDVRIFDEIVFNQLNVEWTILNGDPGSPDAMFFESVGGIKINGLHLEQIQLTNFNAAMMLISDGARVIIDGLTLSNSQIQSGGAHALVRTFGDCHLDLTGFYQHDNTVAGTFTLLNASGATAGVASARASAVDTSIFTALVGSEKAAPQQMLREVNGDVFLRKVGGKVETYGTAAPVAGTWAVGDRVWDTDPAAGATPGWVCTTAGTPGTWKAMASLAA